MSESDRPGWARWIRSLTRGPRPLLLIALMVFHLGYAALRFPVEVAWRRISDISEYREEGAARYLLRSAQIEGADELEWLLAHTSEDSAILWRWPADGALEFAAPLLAPRLVVDERAVPAGATRYAGRPIASGTPPASNEGLIVLQGLENQGLRLTTRSR